MHTQNIEDYSVLQQLIVRVPAGSVRSIMRAAGIKRTPQSVYDETGRVRSDADSATTAHALGKMIERVVKMHVFSSKEISRKIKQLTKEEDDGMFGNMYEASVSYQLMVALDSRWGIQIPEDIEAQNLEDYCAAILCLQGDLHDAAPNLATAAPTPTRSVFRHSDTKQAHIVKIVYWILVHILAVVGVVALIGIAVGTPAPSAEHEHAANEQPAAAQPMVEVDQMPRAGQPAFEPLRMSGEPRMPIKSLEVVMGKTSLQNHRLFVFSDPLCPYCKRLEPQLSVMAARGYEVHVFPTPIHDESRQFIAGIACSSDKVSAWRDAIMSERYATDGECPAGRTAADEALGFFRQFGFNQTPTVINDAGEVHIGLFASDDEMAAFIERK